MKKILITILLVLCITGCVNYTELNELLVVTSIGIDYKDDKYIVYLSTVDGKFDDNDIEKEYKTYKEEGTTLVDAFNKLYQVVDKKIYLSHLDLLVLSNDVLTSNLDEVVKTFLYDIENRSSFNCFTTDDVNSLLEFPNFVDKLSDLSKTLELEISSISNITFDNLITLVLEGDYFIIPNIKKNNDDLSYHGGVLINDGKIIDVDKDDMIIYNYLTNNINRTNIDNIPVLNNYTVLKTKMNKISISIISDIYDMDVDKYPSILKVKINEFLDKYYNKERIDILNIKKLIYQNHYHYYQKNKNNLLDLLNFDISVKTSSISKEVNYEK